MNVSNILATFFSNKLDMIDIKAFRKKNKITQVELADFLGTTHGFISQVERGKSKLSDDKLEMLRNNKLGWIIDDILEPEGTTSIPKNGIESLYDIIKEQQETIKTQQAIIRTQSETIKEQSETINMMASPQRGCATGDASSVHSSGTHSRI